jgi:hypothetical protein
MSSNIRIHCNCGYNDRIEYTEDNVTARISVVLKTEDLIFFDRVIFYKIDEPKNST